MDKERRARALTNSLTDAHHSNLKEWVWSFRRELEAHSLPLHVQSAMMFELIKLVIEHGTLYFSRRSPKELANFNWLIDAKGAFDITPQVNDISQLTLMQAGEARPLSHADVAAQDAGGARLCGVLHSMRWTIMFSWRAWIPRQ